MILESAAALMAAGSLTNAGVLTRMWHSSRKSRDEDILMGRADNLKRMPLVEKIIERKYVAQDITTKQRSTALFFANKIRGLVNTKMFDLFILALYTNNQKLKSSMSWASKIEPWARKNRNRLWRSMK